MNDLATIERTNPWHSTLPKKVRALRPPNADEILWERHNQHTVYADDAVSLRRALRAEHATVLIENMHIHDATLDFSKPNNVMLRDVTFERCRITGLTLDRGANYGVIFRNSYIDEARIYGVIDDCIIDNCWWANADMSHCRINTLHMYNSQLRVFANRAAIHTLILENALIQGNVTGLRVETLQMQAAILDRLHCNGAGITTLQHAAATPVLANTVRDAVLQNIFIRHDDMRER